IPGGVAGGEIHRRRAAVHRRLEQIEVGRPGLGVPGDARREHQRAAVGTEGEVLIATEGFAGNVRIEALRHVDRGRARSAARTQRRAEQMRTRDRKSTRLNSSHSQISYAVFCLKKKKKKKKKKNTREQMPNVYSLRSSIRMSEITDD